MSRALHPHQERALGMLRNAIRSGKRRPMLQLPMGAGKTRIAAEITHGVLGKSGRLIFTGSRSLLNRPNRRFVCKGRHP